MALAICVSCITTFTCSIFKTFQSCIFILSRPKTPNNATIVLKKKLHNILVALELEVVKVLDVKNHHGQIFKLLEPSLRL
jgi:hypothetical protein